MSDNNSQRPEHTPEAMDAAFKFVGRFFWNWAAFEGSIDTVIARLFGIDLPLKLILAANLNFSAKLYIIETTLLWQGASHSEEWKKRARKLCARIGRLNRSRNLMAHNLFVPLKSKSIRFYKTEARGELNLPEIKWSPKDFERTYKLIQAAGTELHELTVELRNRQDIMKSLIAAPSPATTPSTWTQGLLDILYHRAQSPPGSHTGKSSPKTSPQSDPKTQEKPEG